MPQLATDEDHEAIPGAELGFDLSPPANALTVRTAAARASASPVFRPSRSRFRAITPLADGCAPSAPSLGRANSFSWSPAVE